MRVPVMRIGEKGMAVSSQNPVHRVLAHSTVRSNAQFLVSARPLAATTNFTQGDSQYRSLARMPMAALFSGLFSRHLRALLRQNSGSVSYASLRAAFLAGRSFRANQSARELCHFMAHLWVQNLKRFPASSVLQVRQSFAGLSSIFARTPRILICQFEGAK